MLTRTVFLNDYPEFATAPTSLVDAKLVDAAAMIDPVLYSGTTDVAHGLLTAHLLATSPSGQNARMQSDKGSSVYWEPFVQLQLAAATGIRVF